MAAQDAVAGVDANANGVGRPSYPSPTTDEALEVVGFSTRMPSPGSSPAPSHHTADDGYDHGHPPDP